MHDHSEFDQKMKMLSGAFWPLCRPIATIAGLSVYYGKRRQYRYPLTVRATGPIELGATMKPRLTCLIQLTIVLLSVTVSVNLCRGTDRFYSDKDAQSANGRYRLTAKSPDNANPALRLPFQGGFVYVLRDIKAQKDLWTRKQTEDKPITLEDGAKPFVIRTWKEASPVAIHVQDGGWSVLWLDNDELVVVGRDGKESGKLKILSDAFSVKEGERTFQMSTAGPMWGRERSYFVTHDRKAYFVVRTWWGHRVILDLAAGRLTTDGGALAKHLEIDRAFVRTTLEAAAKEIIGKRTNAVINSVRCSWRSTWRAKCTKECVPLLRSLEECSLQRHLGDNGEQRHAEGGRTGCKYLGNF